MGSVDCWLLAIILTRRLGVSPDRYPASAVTGERYPPLERRMSQVPKRKGCLSSLKGIIVADRHLGNSVGAIGWHPGGVCTRCSKMLRLFSLGVEVHGGFSLPFTLLPSNYSGLPSFVGWRFFSGGPNPSPGFWGSLVKKIVTWLILPVVICLSQRLSHACLSISNLYGETANGSLNQLSFI
jgi:hypothetical protein